MCFGHRFASFLAGLLLVTVVGCDGPVTVEQRLVGAWRGRAESAAERVEREWPTAEANADSSAEELQAALAKITPTMLEKHQGFQIELDFGAGGDARLTLDGARPIEGRWRLLTSEGRRASVEIAVEHEGQVTEQRRFQIEFLLDDQSFVLREEGADKQFGRLLFQRP